ncbi:hypothetical protein RN51_00877 [Microbacterium oxydans]|uniref:Uncharacterized protein n=1 Tax=Microbacterium oxydans TaxID=82380 RepID=A0A0F0KV39_9MICO|nr:hypothetical protein RN51_00877 [Microbacterium oxydans]
MDRLHGKPVGEGFECGVGSCRGAQHPSPERGIGDRRRERIDLLIRDAHVPHLPTIQTGVPELFQCSRRRGGEHTELRENHRGQISGIHHRLTRRELAAPRGEPVPALGERAVEAGEDRGDLDACVTIGIECDVLRLALVIAEHRVVDPQHALRPVRGREQEVPILVAAQLLCRHHDPPAVEGDTCGIGRADGGAHQAHVARHARCCPRCASSRLTSCACRASELP